MSLTAGLFNSGLFKGGLFNSGLFESNANASLASIFFGSGEPGGLYFPLDLSMLWQDTAGTVPATAAGQLIARVDDLSGNGNHCIQATTAARPALQQTAGGFWYLAEDGVDDQVSTSAATVPGIGSSFFSALGIRADALTGAAAQTQVFGLYKAVTSFSGCRVRLSGGSVGQCTFAVRYNSGTQIVGPANDNSLSDLAAHVASGGYNGSVVYARIDGVALTPSTARTPTADEPGYFSIRGTSSVGAPYSFFGGLYVVTSSITPEKIAFAEQEIASLCGVTLP